MPEPAGTTGPVAGVPVAAPPERGAARLAAFAGALVLALVGGFGLGRLTGSPAPGPGAAAVAANSSPDSGAAPAGPAAAGHSHAPGTAPHSHDGADAHSHDGADAHTHEPGTAPHAHDGATPATGAPPGAGTEVGGLAVSSAGLTLVAERTTFRAGATQPLRFRIVGTDGRPVTAYGTLHDRAMHLVVVRRDLTGYQHLHPALAADGTWSVSLRLPTPGPWRAVADFVAVDPNGVKVPTTLGVDLVAAGGYTPAPLPDQVRSTTVDGFTVAYEGVPRRGATQPLLFQVSRNGAAVTDLERYLGAYGHLVVLREGDLGYVHVHPDEQRVGTAVRFWLAPPSPGRYRMFLDFQVAGKVRTAAFTLVVG
jgi:hypothetical protein